MVLNIDVLNFLYILHRGRIVYKRMNEKYSHVLEIQNLSLNWNAKFCSTAKIIDYLKEIG